MTVDVNKNMKDGLYRLWETQTWKSREMGTSHWADYGFAWSPDSRTVATFPDTAHLALFPVEGSAARFSIDFTLKSPAWNKQGDAIDHWSR